MSKATHIDLGCDDFLKFLPMLQEASRQGPGPQFHNTRVFAAATPADLVYLNSSSLLDCHRNQTTFSIPTQTLDSNFLHISSGSNNNKADLKFITCNGSEGLKPLPPLLAHGLSSPDSTEVGAFAVVADTSKKKTVFKSGSASKNLVSERKRRKKLNERLYSLRAIVPKISKMDKASIVADAIEYVQDLKKNVRQLEEDVLSLEVAEKQKTDQLQLENVANAQLKGIANCLFADVDQFYVKQPKQDSEKKSVEIEVSKLEDQVFFLRINCGNSDGVLIQLAKGFESIGLDFCNGTLSSFEGKVINSFITRMEEWKYLTIDEVKDIIFEMASKFGIHG